MTHLIQAFGNPDPITIASIFFERAVKKRNEKTGLIDMLWDGRMLFELKSRGENLKNHYDQLFEYWLALVPRRPRYAVLCNFDEIWIYDFNIQLNDPIHRMQTQNLLDDWQALAFLFPKPETPLFNNNNVEVTKRAANILGALFISLSNRIPNLEVKSSHTTSQEDIRRFVLQLVVALFAENVGLLPKKILLKILQKSALDLNYQIEIDKLFKAMAAEDEKEKTRNYRDVFYFNGGLFTKIKVIKLNLDEILLLGRASEENWSCVRPSIFGAIFESSMNEIERHTYGAHFTSELDIQKIIYPTIVKPFQEKIEKAHESKNAKKQLASILAELENLKVLDPACGSGNFLYIAYRELVRLEMMILKKLYKNFDDNQSIVSRITPQNFYGIDINSFGVELAKVALSIGRKLAADEFNIFDHSLPFDNLDKNIICADALFTKWPVADAIVGNPPFLGNKRMKGELGDNYVEKIRQHFSDLPKDIDFCTYWFRLAHDSKAKRCGLVATNSITQNTSRLASLDYILKNDGFIHDAHASQIWPGEAVVHVSIVNWIKEKPSEYFLNGKKVHTINSSLKNEIDVTSALKIPQNTNLSFVGCITTGRGFIISKEEATLWIKKDKKNQKVLKPLVDGVRLLNPSKEPEWVIDFFDMSLEEASCYKLPFEHVKKNVRPIREKDRVKSHREKWWLFTRPRPAMRRTFKNLKYYFAISRVSKYTNFKAVSTKLLPEDSLVVIASDDFYILGILNSQLHRDWVKAQSSTLKGDTRYTNTTCFETFPFLQNVSESGKQKIRDVMTELENLRNAECIKRKISLTTFYNEFVMEPQSKLYQLHQELDRLICDAYGWKHHVNKNYNEELFKLNKKLTS